MTDAHDLTHAQREAAAARAARLVATHLDHGRRAPDCPTARPTGRPGR